MVAVTKHGLACIVKPLKSSSIVYRKERRMTLPNYVKAGILRPRQIKNLTRDQNHLLITLKWYFIHLAIVSAGITRWLVILSSAYVINIFLILIQILISCYRSLSRDLDHPSWGGNQQAAVRYRV